MVGARYIGGVVLSLGLLLVAIWWGFAYFHEAIYEYFDMESSYTLFFEEIGVSVTVADEPAQWQKGLSGTPALGELEGKLFVFDTEGTYGIWMKDMLFALDILWIDDSLQVVHIEESVTPETYPRTFASPMPARFVLEVNDGFVASFGIEVGATISMPRAVVPSDLQGI